MKPAILTLLTISSSVWVQPTIPPDPEPRWWRGNLHTHTFWSDGNDFPEMVAEWYATHGYNFLAFSDHNTLSRGKRWMDIGTINTRSRGSAFPASLECCGNLWVETRRHSPEIGRTLAEVHGTTATYRCTGNELSIRAVIESDAAPERPRWENLVNGHGYRLSSRLIHNKRGRPLSRYPLSLRHTAGSLPTLPQRQQTPHLMCFSDRKHQILVASTLRIRYAALDAGGGCLSILSFSELPRLGEEHA